MAQIKQQVGTRTALTVTGLSTLAAATYAVSNIYTANTNQPLDIIAEVTIATTNTPASNKQVVVFIQESLDGTNFRTGPTSGTTTTDEPDLRIVGVVPVNSASTNHTVMFSISQTLGYMPFAFRLVFKNDLGVALTSATVFTSELTATSV